jgi:hypothetical protein
MRAAHKVFNMPVGKMSSRELSHNGSALSAADRESDGKSAQAPSTLAREHEQSIRLELQRILGSRYFKSAGRSRQFLQYVVEHRLTGHADQLKERTIGTDVFQRPADYATGDDPVVRVQAGEVRRRLEQFYQHEGADSAIRVELPVGSYCPEFHQTSELTKQVLSTAPEADLAVKIVHPPPQRVRSMFLWGIGAVGVIALITVTLVLSRQPEKQRAVLQSFWGPVFSTPQPALICLAKGITYRPSAELYARYQQSHPGTFQTEVEKSSDPLPLDPDETVKWRELGLYSDYGVATGDVYAAIRISGVLGQLGKPAQLRIGSDYSFQDLRNSPGVIVGAFNNKWTMSLMSNLHFTFVEQNGRFLIHEQSANGRIWPLPSENIAHHASAKDGQPSQPSENFDYGIVARLMDSNTGQFTILAAGLTGAGTAAAGEFISSPQLLESAYHDAPSDWKKSNSIFVLKTKVTDGVSGPPSVVASYYW